MTPMSTPDSEALRSALDAAWDSYCVEHYRHGVPAVFDQSEDQQCRYVMCIEDHQFQSHNYWYVEKNNNTCSSANAFMLSHR